MDVQPAFLVGPFDDPADMDNVIVALSGIFPKASIEPTTGVQGYWFFITNVHCSREGLIGFAKGVMIAKRKES